MKQVFSALLTLLLANSIGHAQENGSIVGLLSDKEANNAPLAFANVLVKGTTKGTTSDFDGLYKITEVAPGRYILVFSFLGYDTLEIPDVVVESGKVTEVNLALGAGSVSLDEVVVTVSSIQGFGNSIITRTKKRSCNSGGH